MNAKIDATLRAKTLPQLHKLNVTAHSAIQTLNQNLASEKIRLNQLQNLIGQKLTTAKGPQRQTLLKQRESIKQKYQTKIAALEASRSQKVDVRDSIERVIAGKTRTASSTRATGRAPSPPSPRGSLFRRLFGR